MEVCRASGPCLSPRSMGARSRAAIFMLPRCMGTLDTARLGAELVILTLAAGALVLALRARAG